MSKVVLHYSGFRQFRRDGAVQRLLDEQAERIAKRANDRTESKGVRYEAVPARESSAGSVALVTTGHGTWTAVRTMKDQAENNTLFNEVSG